VVSTGRIEGKIKKERRKKPHKKEAKGKNSHSKKQRVSKRSVERRGATSEERKKLEKKKGEEYGTRRGKKTENFCEPAKKAALYRKCGRENEETRTWDGEIGKTLLKKASGGKERGSTKTLSE